MKVVQRFQSRGGKYRFDICRIEEGSAAGMYEWRTYTGGNSDGMGGPYPLNLINIYRDNYLAALKEVDGITLREVPVTEETE